MIRRAVALHGLLLVGVVTSIDAQDAPLARQALEAYRRLDYPAAIQTAHRALATQPSRADRIALYELLGFSYGALDSTRQAVDAFRELIFLDPDREPDVGRVSPRITSLYASALGQVLVVRRIQSDTASFVAGQGSTNVRFQLSRPARVVVRAVGAGLDVVVDTLSVAGEGRAVWGATDSLGDPVPEGTYQFILTAGSGREEFAGQILLDVRHGRVDTLSHLTALPGYDELPETEIPPRNWRPLGLATLYTAIGAGAALALENTSLGTDARREVAAVGAVTLLAGFVLSLKRPDPRPLPSNVLYNQLLREQLARRNAEIAGINASRRRQTLISVAPATNRE